MANPFDQFDAVQPPASTGNPFDQFDSHTPAAAPQRPAGATNPFDMIGQTFQDLTDPNHPNHDPNAIESTLIGATYSKPIQSLQANYQQAVNTGLFMEPVRASMEALGVGRQQGESNASLHARYNGAITQARQSAQQQMQNNTVGSYTDGNPFDALERFSQQAVNTGAGIVANPQYFMLPGMGVGGNIATRVATAGLGNAAVGGVSDAAAQLMDIAEGQKKNYDVNQSLQATLTSGLFGAALHGAVEATPFVKNLYANRGMDTTPGANPTGGTIQPMTGDHVAMNAADHMQYQQLLQTGNVDDIKQFFQGRQGPQPSWTDVNTWVEHRDNPPAATNGVAGADPSRMPDFNYQDEYNQHAEQTYRDTQRQAVQDHVDNITKGWANAPDVNVVHGPEDIADPAVRDSVLKADPQGNALGLFGSDGQVHMFSGRITDPDVASAVLFHEGLGHYGLSQLFGNKLNQTLVSMADSNVGQFGKLVEARQAANPGESRALSAEEVLAEQSQNGQIKPSWQLALNSVVRRFGRRMGMKLDMNDAEVQHVLSMAHDAVVKGKSVQENGFRGATQDPNNKFMFTGQMATGFDKEHPSVYTAKDGITRNEISDREARLYESPGDTLGSTLHHPELFEQYPELHSLPVVHEYNPNSKFAGGYDPHNPETGTGGKMYLNRGSFYHNMDPLGVVLHETQHAIQDIEKYPDFVRAMKSGGTGHDPLYSYADHPSEQEARAVEQRIRMREGAQERYLPKFMHTDQLGREITDPEHLDEIDRLKADPRYWQDPEYRANVNEMARVRATQQENGGNKFMRSSALNDAFTKLPPESQEEWRQAGMRSHLSDWNVAVNQFDRLSRFVENNKHLLGTDTHAILQDFTEQNHPIVQEPAGRRLIRAMSDTTRGPDNAVTQLLTRLKTDEIVKQQQMDALHEAKTPGGILENMPRHLIDHLEKNIDENGDLPPRLSMSNKFITRAQLARSRATKTNYDMDDLEGVAAHVEANYTPNVMSRDEVRTAAIENGINPNDLKGRDVGELATRLSKIGYAARYAAIKVGGILDRLDTPNWKPEDHVKLAEAIAQRNALVSMFKGEGNELGRALATAKVFKELTNGHLSEIMDRLREEGSGLAALADPTNPEALKFARQLKQALQSNSNPKGANALMQNVVKPYWEQYLTTFHMNAMLSALSTHVKAPVDMATGITREVLEKALSIPVSKARQMYQAMTGKVVEPGVEVAELFNHIHGIMAAVTDMEVYRAAAHALRTGESSFVSNGQRTPTQFANQFGAISNPRLGNTTSVAGKAVGLLNKPTDLISAQDTVFRSVATNAHLLSIATREARLQMPGGTTSDIMTLGRQIAQNPHPSMLREAFKEANRTLLLNDNPLNTLINKGRIYKPNMNPFERGLNFSISNLAPFIRIESNVLLERVINRSPLGLYQLMDPRSDLRAGGAKSDIAMTRIMYGSVLMGMYWMLAGQKNTPLTGAGPDNVNKYKEKIASGWRPDAVHENGGYNTGGQLGMSVNPFDVHNKTAQLVASARQAYDAGMSAQGWGNAFKMGLGSVLSNLAGMSWISDIQPAVDAARAHGQEGQSTVNSFIGHEAATWVPGGVRQASQLADPVQRDTSAPGSISGTAANEILNETPFRSNLPIKYSVYGDPLAAGTSLTGVHTIVPGLSGNGTTETQDPAERELDRLSSMTTSAIVTPVTHTISADPDDSSQGKIALKPAQIEEYQRLAGKSLVYYVQQDLDDGSWAKMTDDQRVEEVRSIETDSKKAAAQAIREQIK